MSVLDGFIDGSVIINLLDYVLVHDFYTSSLRILAGNEYYPSELLFVKYCNSYNEREKAYKFKSSIIIFLLLTIYKIL